MQQTGYDFESYGIFSDSFRQVSNYFQLNQRKVGSLDS